MVRTCSESGFEMKAMWSLMDAATDGAVFLLHENC